MYEDLYGKPSDAKWRPLIEQVHEQILNPNGKVPRKVEFPKNVESYTGALGWKIRKFISIALLSNDSWEYHYLDPNINKEDKTKQYNRSIDNYKALD